MPSKSRSYRTIVLTGLAASALFLAAPVHAQTDVTGTSSGTDGDPSAGSAPDDIGTSYGNDAGDGYFANGSGASPFTVHDATFTGGVGGAVDGADGTATTYLGGSGGNGLHVDGTATATVNRGTFTGGMGGSATSSGNAQRNQGGNGGNGTYVGGGSTATINGGTFTGGTGGTGMGIANDTLTGGYGGSGLNVNNR